MKMKPLLITLCANFLACTSFAAHAEDLLCQTSTSTQVISEQVVTVAEHEKVKFEEQVGFSLMVHNLGHSQFELEIFDANGESRSYATGFLHSKDDILAWSIWSRTVLLETSCKLNL
jgi:hypothetical protein